MSGRVHAEAQVAPKSSFAPVRTGLLAGSRGKELVSQPPLIQAKLTINQPGDRYEQEADRVADAVMRMPEPCLQRQIEPEEEEEEEELIQAKETSGQIPHVSTIIQNQIHSLRGGGQPLSPSLRNFFEPRFGHDFSRVRVHTDAEAAQAAQAVNARAYTVGGDVVFGAGQYAPKTMVGQRLIAHELTHVVQDNSQSHTNNHFGTVLRRSVESDAAQIESLLSYGIFDWEITDEDAIEALEILSNLPTSMQEAVLRRINVGRLRENLPPTHQHILTRILAQAGGEPAADMRTTVRRIQDLLSYGLFDWAITDSDATDALNLLLSLPPDEQQRVVLVINYQRLYDNLPTEEQKNQLMAIRGPAAARETTDVAMMEGYRARARIILDRIKASASALTISAPPAGSAFETWLSRNYLSSYCAHPSRSEANTAIDQITEEGAGGFTHYGYGLLRGMADRAGREGVTFIDSPYLLGTPAPAAVAGGMAFDPWSQGPNLTDLMHFAAGMKWSWAPAFLVQWYFIHYEETTHEGWQIFGLDALNDIIAEEGGRLFANDLKNTSVTCSGSAVVDLDPYFLRGRRFLRGHLNESRLDRVALRVYQPNLVVAVNATGEIVENRPLWNTTIMEQIMSGASDADILASPDAQILMMLYHLVRIG